MTKLAVGAVDRHTDHSHRASLPRYTHCKKCGFSVCVDCWDCVALELDKLMASARGLLMHDVWHVLLSWNFRTGALRCRGFEARYGGGGTWLSCCPLYVEIKFQPPSPAKPLTMSGREYGLRGAGHPRDEAPRGLVAHLARGRHSRPTPQPFR